MDFSYEPGNYLVIVTTRKRGEQALSTASGSVQILGDGFPASIEAILVESGFCDASEVEDAAYTLVSLIPKLEKQAMYTLHLNLQDTQTGEESNYQFYTLLGPDRNIVDALQDLGNVIRDNLVVVGFSYAHLCNA